MRQVVARRTVLVAIAVVGATCGAGLRIGDSAGTAAAPLPAFGPGPAGWAVPRVVDTNFAPPANAVYVAVTGNDRNPGTIAAPLRNVHTAIAVAPAGATIVVRAGTYRESLGLVRKRVTIQPYPHETVWIKGSAVLTAWTRSGNTWIASNWNPPLCRRCYPSGVIDPSYPLAGHGDQVFRDGAPLREVASATAVGASTFFFDGARHALVIGADPTGHQMEATQTESAGVFQSPAAGSVVRGIGFAQFAPHYNMDVPAMMVVDAPNTTVQDDTFAWSATRGLSVLAPGATVTDNIFVDNGANGFHANAADGIDFERNTITWSNFEHFSITPSSSAAIAGAKITTTAHGTYRRNLVTDNASNGLWLDVSCYDSIVADNAALRNAGHGIAVEISGYTIVAGNVASDNARNGLKISGATDLQAWNNTFANNGWAQIGVYEDPRHNPRPVHGITWDTANVQLVNNVAFAPVGVTHPIFESFDASNPRTRTTARMVSLDDRNLWSRAGGPGAPRYVATWQAVVPRTTDFVDLASFVRSTNRETISIGVDATSAGQIFVAPSAGNYALSRTSAARVAGLPIPAAVAAAMGVAPGWAAQLGAYSAPVG